MNTKYNPIRPDHRIILEWLEPGSSVLDLGCNSGDLLALLRQKNIRGQGLERDEQAIYACVSKGLSVCHGDLDSGLADYGDALFDYVILNQSLQEVKNPAQVLSEALRVGKMAIVGFSNFAHYRVRGQIFFAGKTPVTAALPYEWYSTPNLHFLSIRDFTEYCQQQTILIEKAAYLSNRRRIAIWPNLLAQIALFLVRSG
jgi:methionine biosynthesis protein MetW